MSIHSVSYNSRSGKAAQASHPAGIEKKKPRHRRAVKAAQRGWCTSGHKVRSTAAPRKKNEAIAFARGGRIFMPPISAPREMLPARGTYERPLSRGGKHRAASKVSLSRGCIFIRCTGKSVCMSSIARIGLLCHWARVYLGERDSLVQCLQLMSHCFVSSSLGNACEVIRFVNRYMLLANTLYECQGACGYWIRICEYTSDRHFIHSAFELVVIINDVLARTMKILRYVSRLMAIFDNRSMKSAAHDDRW